MLAIQFKILIVGQEAHERADGRVASLDRYFVDHIIGSGVAPVAVGFQKVGGKGSSGNRIFAGCQW